ncbi:MAG: copper homeostasis protein CutC, partial [Spirochaetaceae bacterium]|nr:copper homeostasis protein CutC [Spirochaetaceae bacterium]
MSDSIIFEALCGSADDAVLAAAAGADRVELNASLGEGGLTPSPGSVRLAKERGGIPVLAMLRPRPSGFAYSEIEFEVMLEDARALLSA